MVCRLLNFSVVNWFCFLLGLIALCYQQGYKTLYETLHCTISTINDLYIRDKRQGQLTQPWFTVKRPLPITDLQKGPVPDNLSTLNKDITRIIYKFYFKYSQNNIEITIIEN